MFLAGLVITSLTACSSNDITIPDENDTNTKYQTYLTVNLTSAETIQTRTNGANTPSNSDISGSEIKSAHVYLVQNGMIMYSTSQVTVNDSAKELVVKAPEGEYKLFVVVNPTTTEPRAGGPINTVLDEITHEIAKNGFKSGNFLMVTMSNETSILKAGTPITITSANISTKPAKASATVDRASVKIINESLGQLTIDDASDIAKIEVANTANEKFFNNSTNPIEAKGFALVNGNTKMNLIQKWEAINKDGVEGTVIETPQGKEVVIDVTNNWKEMQGYYNPITALGEVKMIRETVGDEKAIIVEKIDHTVGNPDNFFEKEDIYTVENRPEFSTLEKLTSGMAKTTGIIYRTVTNNNNTFYMFGNVIYTSKDDLLDIEAFKPRKDELKNKTYSELRAEGIKVYENGNMYYTYFIVDNNANHSVNYHGVKTFYNVVHRNSIYNITINSVKNIGDDIPGGGKITPDNPNPPVTPNDLILDVSVSIQPWILNNIGIDL